MILFSFIFSINSVYSVKSINGNDLKSLIDCFADYLPNASLRVDNSQINGCDFSDIIYCKTDLGHDDHFCLFSGTNHLEVDWNANPMCHYNCQMETCDAWDIPHTDHQQECVEQLF